MRDGWTRHDRGKILYHGWCDKISVGLDGAENQWHNVKVELKVSRRCRFRYEVSRFLEISSIERLFRVRGIIYSCRNTTVLFGSLNGVWHYKRRDKTFYKSTFICENSVILRFVKEVKSFVWLFVFNSLMEGHDPY